MVTIGGVLRRSLLCATFCFSSLTELRLLFDCYNALSSFCHAICNTTALQDKYEQTDTTACYLDSSPSFELH